MTPIERIDAAFAGLRARSGGRSETEDVSRQNHPERETRPRHERENNPDYFQRSRCMTDDRATNSWSGGSFRGDNWSGGRSR